MRHSTDFTHVLIYHVGPFVLVAILLYAGLLLVLKLARRSEKLGKGKQPKDEGFNRQKRREARAMNKRKRRSDYRR